MDTRLARMAVAADLIEDALATGDLRVAGFVLAELRARRDPRASLAALLLARRRALLASLPPPEPAVASSARGRAVPPRSGARHPPWTFGRRPGRPDLG